MIFLILWGLFFLSPLIAPYLLNPNIFPLYSAPFFIAVALLMLLTKNANKPILVPYSTAAILIIFLFFQIVTIIFSGAQASQIFSCWLVIFIASFFTYLISSNQSAHTIKLLSTLFLSAAICWLLAAVPVWLGWTSGNALVWADIALTTDQQTKLNGPFINGNVFGILLACAWSLACYRWISSSDPKHQWFWWAIMLFFWIWSISTLSRGVWLAQSLATLFVVIQLWEYSKKRILIFILSASLSWLIAIQISTHANESSQYLIQNSYQSTVNHGLDQRLIIWRSVTHVIAEHPLLGVGFGNLGAHYLSGQAKTLQEPYFLKKTGLFQTNYAHNILLQMWAEGGISGLILCLIISGTLLFKLYTFRDYTKATALSSMSIICASMLWVQGFFNITFLSPFTFIIFSLFLGLGCSKNKLQPKREFPLPSSFIISTLFIVIILSGLGMFSTIQKWRALDQWLTTDLLIQKNNDSAKLIVGNETLDPLLIETWVANSILTQKDWRPSEKLPYIQYALSLEQRPLLLRESFVTHAALGMIDEACQVGKFITAQHWHESTSNRTAYKSACGHTQVKAFNLTQ